MSYSRVLRLSFFWIWFLLGFSGPTFGVPEFYVKSLSNGQRVFLKGKQSKRALIYVSKDCLSCRAYLKELQSCPSLAFDLVHLGAPRELRSTRPLYAFEPKYWLTFAEARTMGLAATPTTIWAGKKQVGTMSCDQVAAFVKGANR